MDGLRKIGRPKLRWSDVIGTDREEKGEREKYKTGEDDIVWPNIMQHYDMGCRAVCSVSNFQKKCYAMFEWHLMFLWQCTINARVINHLGYVINHSPCSW